MCDLRAFLVLQSFRQNWQIYPEDSTCLDSTCSNREVLNLVWWPQSAHLHTTPFSVLSLTIFSSTAAKNERQVHNGKICLLMQGLIFFRLVWMLSRDMRPQGISSSTKLIAMGTIVTSRFNMLWLNVLKHHWLKLSLVATINTLPQNPLVSLMFDHLLLHSS